MLVVSKQLTTGQITFILRLVIQILAYGGLFLIGLIILGNSPRVATVETHDTLNRVVGKSTMTSTTLRWIKNRLFGKARDPSSSALLLFSLILFLLYGLFVSLSDVGFIGLQACSVPFDTYSSFPASVNSEAQALALVSKNLLPGIDPSKVNSYRCGASEDLIIDANVSERICTQWINTTYADVSSFRSLNLTDSDIFMNKYLSRFKHVRSDVFDLNTYYMDATASPVFEPTIDGGMAVIPHETGVRVIAGVPNLSKNQTVTIPKTTGVEVAVGCMPLGVIGQRDSSSITQDDRAAYDWFRPDAIYKANRRSNYTGPDNLYTPLETAADTIRDMLRPLFNESITDDGMIRSINSSLSVFSYQTKVTNFFKAGTNGTSLSFTPTMKNCADQINKALNISTPSKALHLIPFSCNIYSLLGSVLENGHIYQGYSVMVCASSTAINMVSATLDVDKDGRLTAGVTPLPSDLHIVQASYYDITVDNTTNTTVYGGWGTIDRYTLSDNPSGPLQHYIYQQFPLGGLTHGAGGGGSVLSRVGGKVISVDSISDSAGALMVVDPKFFGAQSLNTSLVTKWAGGVGASYLLASLGFNGLAALDKAPLSIQSTGGRLATCYEAPFIVAFLPLLIAAFIVIVWSLQMLVSSKLRSSKKWERLYGGLSPAIVAPVPSKQSPDTVLAWEDTGDHAHLRHLPSSFQHPDDIDMPTLPSETEKLVTTDSKYS